MLLLAERCTPAAMTAIQFTQSMLGGSSAAFYRVASDMTPYDFTLSDVPMEFHRHYIEDMNRFDPLHVRRLANQRRSFARFDQATGTIARADYSRFRAFFDNFDMSDAIEFLFRRDGRVFAGLSVSWKRGQAMPDNVSPMAEQIQSYVEFNLQRDIDDDGADDLPADRYGLTARELEVSELLCCGRTNQQIAEVLRIGLPTVKTHLIHIFDKLGVENRTAAVALLPRRA